MYRAFVKPFISVVTICIAAFLCLGNVSKENSSSQQNKRIAWVAPAEANKIVNPLKGNPAATAAGKKIFDQACVPCHGPKGMGDGVAAVTLTPRPATLAGATVQAQTDGAIFWKITNGNPPMAPYKTVYTDAQRWQIVNYIRLLKL